MRESEVGCACNTTVCGAGFVGLLKNQHVYQQVSLKGSVNHCTMRLRTILLTYNWSLGPLACGSLQASLAVTKHALEASE